MEKYILGLIFDNFGSFLTNHTNKNRTYAFTYMRLFPIIPIIPIIPIPLPQIRSFLDMTKTIIIRHIENTLYEND